MRALIWLAVIISSDDTSSDVLSGTSTSWEPEPPQLLPEVGKTVSPMRATSPLVVKNVFIAERNSLMRVGQLLGQAVLLPQLVGQLGLAVLAGKAIEPDLSTSSIKFGLY